MRRILLPLALAAIAFPSAGAAQNGPSLIRRGIQAFIDFDNDAARPLLRQGLNPAAGPQDSLWAMGVQAQAQILFDDGEPTLANVWARFGMRFVPDMVFDSLNIIPEVLDILTSARTDVRPTADDPLGDTRWLWPAGDPSGNGRIQVQTPGLTVQATAVVVGRGVITPQGISLPPGVYQIQVSAAGHRNVQVMREVLPGVTTAITFDLASARLIAENELPPAVRDGTFGRSAGLHVQRFGRTETCAGGVIVGRDGLLLTTYRAIRGADRLEVEVGARRISDGVQVAAYDVAADLAVLKLPLLRNDSTEVAPAPAAGTFVWGMGRADCGEPGMTRTRVAAQGARAGGYIYLADSLAAPLGSPVINVAGALVGLTDGPQQLIPADRTRAILGVARSQVAGRQLQTIAQVGATEGHLFGSVEFRSTTLANAVAEVRPLGALTQWGDELRVQSPLPMTFAGPAGSYEIVVRVNGEVRIPARQFAIRAGQADAVRLDPQAVAAAPPPTPPQPQIEEQREGGGGFPWIIAALGGVGAGVVALLLAGGGGTTEDPTTGGLTLRIPNR